MDQTSLAVRNQFNISENSKQFSDLSTERPRFIRYTAWYRAQLSCTHNAIILMAVMLLISCQIFGTICITIATADGVPHSDLAYYVMVDALPVTTLPICLGLEITMSFATW